MKNHEDKFLGRLLNETYQNTKSEEFPAPSEELRIYFEKKLNEVDHTSLVDYLEGKNLTVSKLDYIDHLKCYRMYFQNQILDFPENWSFFKSLAPLDCVLIDKDFNSDMILDLFSELLEREIELLVIKDKEHAWFVYLNEDQSKDHLDWIRTYIEKSKILEKEKVA